MTLNSFIQKRPYLVWSTQNHKYLSPGAIVEAVLNYADLDDVKKMIAILGHRETARIFQKQIKSKRCNYRPEIKNYFQLYFKKYA